MTCTLTPGRAGRTAGALRGSDGTRRDGRLTRRLLSSPSTWPPLLRTRCLTNVRRVVLKTTPPSARSGERAMMLRVSGRPPSTTSTESAHTANCCDMQSAQRGAIHNTQAPTGGRGARRVGGTHSSSSRARRAQPQRRSRGAWRARRDVGWSGRRLQVGAHLLAAHESLRFARSARAAHLSEDAQKGSTQAQAQGGYYSVRQLSRYSIEARARVNSRVLSWPNALQRAYTCARLARGAWMRCVASISMADALQSMARRVRQSRRQSARLRPCARRGASAAFLSSPFSAHGST